MQTDARPHSGSGTELGAPTHSSQPPRPTRRSPGGPCRRTAYGREKPGRNGEPRQGAAPSRGRVGTGDGRRFLPRRQRRPTRPFSLPGRGRGEMAEAAPPAPGGELLRASPRGAPGLPYRLVDAISLLPAAATARGREAARRTSLCSGSEGRSHRQLATGRAKGQAAPRGRAPG